MLSECGCSRLTRVLDHLGIACSSWYRKAKPIEEHCRPGPPPRAIEEKIVNAVVAMATENPWYGYKRIAVMCRRAGQAVKNREAYKVMRDRGLLQKPKPREAELYQTARLFELLPQKPNDLWQMDVTYLHIPGFGWWYAVTVIDYYSRYLLGCHLTASYSALEVNHALQKAREEAERVGGAFTKPPFLVTDNGSSFLAKRFQNYVKNDFQHVRIRYRTPTQLGLLERFHATLKTEEVYWKMYGNPQEARESLAAFQARYNEHRPHWALVPESGGDPLVPLEVYSEGHTIKIPKWQTWAQAAKAKLDALMNEPVSQEDPIERDGDSPASDGWGPRPVAQARTGGERLVRDGPPQPSEAP